MTAAPLFHCPIDGDTSQEGKVNCEDVPQVVITDNHQPGAEFQSTKRKGACNELKILNMVDIGLTDSTMMNEFPIDNQENGRGRHSSRFREIGDVFKNIKLSSLSHNRRESSSDVVHSHGPALANGVDPSSLGRHQCTAIVVNYISAGYILLPSGKLFKGRRTYCLKNFERHGASFPCFGSNPMLLYLN